LFLTFDFLQQLLSTHLAGWRASQSALSEGAFWRCSRHQQQQWSAHYYQDWIHLRAVIFLMLILTAHLIFGATITSLFVSVLLLY